MERIIQEKNNENILSIEEEIAKLKEEISNVNSAISENDNLKEKIGDSLKKNLRFKNFLKKILLKLISKSQKKETNLEEAYLKIIREKEELEKKNKTYEKHLSNILKEKHIKESKLDQVEDELSRLKKIISEKDHHIKNIQILTEKNKYCGSYSKYKLSQSRGRDSSKNNYSNTNTINQNKITNDNNYKGKNRSSMSSEKNNKNLKSSIISRKAEAKNSLNKLTSNRNIKKISNKSENLFNNFTTTNNFYEENLTEQDRIEINLQDEYVGTKKKFINDINHISVNTNNLVHENIKIEDLDTNLIKNIDRDMNDDIKIEIDLKNLIYNKNASINNQASVQNIKYIINQTNNIVNNNINKIIEKDNYNKLNNFKQSQNTSKKSYKSINKFSYKGNNTNNNIDTVNNNKNNINLRESYKEKIKEAMNLNSKEISGLYKNRMNSLQKSSKRSSLMFNNNFDFEEEKILQTNNEEDFNEKRSLKNEFYKIDSMRQNMKIYVSPKNKIHYEKVNTQTSLVNNVKVNNSKKLREYDLIIENQLNEVYNKKAKEIGDKIKKNIKNGYSKKLISSNKNTLTSKDNNTFGELNNNYNKRIDSLNAKELSQNNLNLNKSLSISCVSINHEIGFCSELDIVDQINDNEVIIMNNLNNNFNNRLIDNKPYVKKKRHGSNVLVGNKLFSKKHKKISIIKMNSNPNVVSNQNNNYKDTGNKPNLNSNNKITKEILIKESDENRTQENEFKRNKENLIKVVHLKEDYRNQQKVNLESMNINKDNNSPNKKNNFEINPSPIKIDTNFVNNFINAKKMKSIIYNNSIELNNKNAEKYINISKNTSGDRNNYNDNLKKNMENNTSARELDENIKNLNISQSENLSCNNKNNSEIKNNFNTNINVFTSQDSFKKELIEKSKRSLINPIPFNTKNSSEIPANKLISKLNSSKSVQGNNLLNSAEIKDEILYNVNNLNSNRNKIKQNTTNNNNPILGQPQSSRVINNINVQKFINTNNLNNDLNSKDNNESHHLNNHNNKNIYFNGSDISKDIYRKIDNIIDIKKYINEKDIKNALLKESSNNPSKNQASLISDDRSSLNKNRNKDSLNNSKEKHFYNLKNLKERSPSLLKKARMERKILKNNDFTEQDSTNKKKDSNLKDKSYSNNINNYDKSQISNNIQNKQNKNNTTRYYSSNKPKNKNSNPLTNHYTNLSNKNNNLNNVNSNFSSYKNKKFETNLARKGSNISKNSVDFVNEYINQKKTKVPSIPNNETNHKNNFEISTEEGIFNRKNIFNVVNCEVDLENIEFIHQNPMQEIKAVFIHNKQENPDKNSNRDKIQVKKYLSSNILDNDFTSKFLSNENNI